MDNMNKVRPFYCGTQCADWRISNCERCKKFDYDNPKCEIDIAIAQAQFGDGTFTPEMAKRMGWTNDCKEYIWMCSEVEWTDEWKEKIEGIKGNK